MAGSSSLLHNAGLFLVLPFPCLRWQAQWVWLSAHLDSPTPGLAVARPWLTFTVRPFFYFRLTVMLWLLTSRLCLVFVCLEAVVNWSNQTWREIRQSRDLGWPWTQRNKVNFGAYQMKKCSRAWLIRQMNTQTNSVSQMLLSITALSDAAISTRSSSFTVDLLISGHGINPFHMTTPTSASGSVQ